MVEILQLLLNIDPSIRILVIITILIGQVIVLFFPKDIFMMYVGLLYGTSIGMIINAISFFGMSWLGYEMGLQGNMGLHEKREHPKVKKVREWIDKYGFKALVGNRLVPIIPTNWISIGSGLGGLERKRYLLLSFLTTLPWAFIWAFIGSNYLHLALEYLPEEFNPTYLLFGFVLFIILQVLIILSKRRSESQKDTITPTSS